MPVRSNRELRFVLIAACAACVLAAWAARAHQQAISYSDYQVHGRTVDARLRFSAADLAPLLKLDQDNDGKITAHDLELLGPALPNATLGSVSLRSSGELCQLDNGARATLQSDGGIVIAGSFKCPQTVTQLEVKLGFLEALASGHTNLSLISFAGTSPLERIAQQGSDSFVVEHQATVGATMVRFFILGIEHIFTGYDHIAFLIGLLLLGGTLRGLIGIISAFTVAHSITLALATLDIVSPPPSIIEPMIALSIVFVAVENLWALRGDSTRPQMALKHRWMITFGFGLIHGFGFASALKELHLPRAGLAATLVTFNLGVEAGQICIVSLLYPGLQLLRRRKPAVQKKVALTASGIIAALGVFWFIQRVFF